MSLAVGLAATALNVVVAVLAGGTTGFIGERLDLVTTGIDQEAFQALRQRLGESDRTSE